ncbi:MAG: hypothetical protein LBE91_03190 [Tannerella sp.]|jgi:hypothetical protein|nr:hypothetical protein [Tannerella sp.]
MKYYSVSGTDNGSEFYYNKDDILKYCPRCGLVCNRDEAKKISINSFYLKKKNYTFSTCYDGAVIVSEKFVEIYEKNNLKGLSFSILPKCRFNY